MILWNPDGIARRIDEILHLLMTKKPTVMVLPEIKADEATLTRLGPEKDLRTTLRSLGYQYVIAATCTLESIGPGNYGVMVISRATPSSVSLGFGDPANPAKQGG